MPSNAVAFAVPHRPAAGASGYSVSARQSFESFRRLLESRRLIAAACLDADIDVDKRERSGRDVGNSRCLADRLRLHVAQFSLHLSRESANRLVVEPDRNVTLLGLFLKHAINDRGEILVTGLYPGGTSAPALRTPASMWIGPGKFTPGTLVRNGTTATQNITMTNVGTDRDSGHSFDCLAWTDFGCDPHQRSGRHPIRVSDRQSLRRCERNGLRRGSDKYTVHAHVFVSGRAIKYTPHVLATKAPR